MLEYLMRFKNVVNMLSYVGLFISEEDQILQLLNGLSIEYNLIMMTITTKLSAYMFDEVSSLLLTIEKNLENQLHNNDSISANLFLEIF